MTIKTKYNVGDKVWFVYEGRIKHWEVRRIKVVVRDVPSIEYELMPQVSRSYLYGPYSEDMLYPTQEKLLKKNKHLRVK